MNERVARIDRLGTIALAVAGGDAPTDGTIAAYRVPGTGFLRARARIARDGLLEYSDGVTSWMEYRSTDDLRAAAPTFSLLLLTDDHPEEFVSIDNAGELGIGFSGQDLTVEPGPDANYMVGTLTFTDPEAVARIEAGKVELSIGFTCSIVDEPGTYQGAPYQRRQTELEGNHIANVDQGRAGPLARIPTADVRTAIRGAAVTTRRIDQAGLAGVGASPMDPVTVDLPGIGQVTIPQAVAEYIAALQSQVPQGNAAAAPAAIPAPAAAVAQQGDSATVARLQAERDAAVARADAAERDAAQRIDQRVALLTAARPIIGDVAVGTPDAEVHRAVALAVFPSLESTIKSKRAADASDRGYLQAMFEQAVATRTVPSTHEIADAARAAAAGMPSGDYSDITDAADELATRRAKANKAKGE